jgi:hypothetical protein
MDWDTVFSGAGTLAMVGWAALILGPVRLRLWPALAIPVALSALHAGLVMAHFAEAGGGFGSIAEVRRLFASDPLLVAGWVHYLAFDLMAGALIAARMDRAGVPRLVQAAPLVCTFLLGPLGFLFGLMTETATRALRRGLERGAG